MNYIITQYNYYDHLKSYFKNIKLFPGDKHCSETLCIESTYIYKHVRM